jgi:tRNA 2-thiouridine synthesizing protein B
MRIFLLTKTPNSERTKICLCLAASSVDAIVYLAGDGVYNLLGQAGAVESSQAGQDLATLVAKDKILACREDLEARSISAEGKATVPADFYECLVDDMMREGCRVYSF